MSPQPMTAITVGAAPFGAGIVSGVGAESASDEIDAMIRRSAAAPPKERARGEQLARALASIADAAPGAKMVAEMRAASVCGLSARRVRQLFRKVRDFEQREKQRAPEAPHSRELRLVLWGTLLTRTKRQRISFMAANPAIAEFCGGFILKTPHLADSKIFALAEAHFSLPKRKRETIERWCRSFRLKNKPEILIASNPDRAKSMYLPAHGRMHDQVQDFLGLVELDGSPSDSFTLSGRRCRLIFAIDVFSRLGAVVVASSESTDAAGRLIVKFQRLYGLPSRIRTDRGSGFISANMKLFLMRAGVGALEITPPYSGERKPFVESFGRALQRFCELLPGFGGHNPAQRQALRGRLSMAQRRGLSDGEILGARLTEAELEAQLDDYLSGIYANQPHAGLGGISPNEKLRRWQAQGGIARRVTDEAALYDLLGEHGLRTVGKRGISVDGRFFAAPALASVPGHQIEFRRLPQRDRLAIFTAGDSHEFIGIAIATDALDPAERQARAMQANAVCRELNSKVRASAKRLVRRLPGAPAEILLSAADRTARVEVAAIPFTTPAIEESRRAHMAAAALPAPDRTGRGNLIALQAPEPELSNPEKRRREYARLMALPSESLSKKERNWLRAYEVLGANLIPGRAIG